MSEMKKCKCCKAKANVAQCRFCEQFECNNCLYWFEDSMVCAFCYYEQSGLVCVASPCCGNKLERIHLNASDNISELLYSHVTGKQHLEILKALAEIQNKSQVVYI